MTIRPWRGLALLLLGVGLTLPGRAAADTESCTRAHAAGQREENAGQLKEALASFQECASDAACPLPIRNECTQLYTTVEGRLPTVVLSVVDEHGNDVVDVQVSSGDALIVHGLDGRPVAINPGLHELRFRLPNGEVVTKSLVVRQGEKDRIVSLKLPRSDLGAAQAQPASPSPAPVVLTSEAPNEQRLTVPVGAWLSYGVGAVALGSWAAFGLLGRGVEKDLIACSPNCEASERDRYDAMKRNYLVADVSLGVAAAGVIVGTVILLTKGRRASSAGADSATTRASQRSLSMAPAALGRTGGALLLQGRY
jgi:hypothetical protein